MPQFMTVEEGASLLDVHPETIRRAIRDKELSAYRFGRIYKFTQDAFDAFIESKKIQKEVEVEG